MITQQPGLTMAETLKQEKSTPAFDHKAINEQIEQIKNHPLAQENYPPSRFVLNIKDVPSDKTLEEVMKLWEQTGYSIVESRSTVDRINGDIKLLEEGEAGKVSDGYHTFDQLYEHRLLLYIALCKSLVATEKKYGNELGLLPSIIWRSRIHSDGSSWPGWFILGLGKTPGYQITYHLPDRMWDLTEFAEQLVIPPDWDGHSSEDVLERLLKYFI